MAERSPLDLLLLIDRSGSMNTRNTTVLTKWEMAQAALVLFVQDRQSSGLGVGVQYFPAVAPCGHDDACGFSAGLVDVVCLERRVCISGSVPAGTPPPCGGQFDEPCPGGTSCVALGYCARSAANCTAIGQPCPGGPADDLCTATARSCRGLSAADCRLDHFQMPAVAIGDLPGNQSALSASLLHTIASGGTPTLPAIEAALAYLHARATMRPDRHQALVLVTDGVPDGCASDPVRSVADQIAAARAATPSVPTYLVGAFGSGEVVTGKIAIEGWAAAGGTGPPFVLDPNADLTQKLVEALDQIRGAALPCEYVIPKPTTGTLDFMKVNVRVTGGANVLDLGYAGGLQQCDPVKGGWYYDLDPSTGTPTRVIMCEATCRRFKAEPATTIELRYGCQTVLIR
jgi:hypothetical protein